MVIVTKKGEITTTVSESGRVLNSLARGRLLRAGVRVPYYIKGDVSRKKNIQSMNFAINCTVKQFYAFFLN